MLQRWYTNTPKKTMKICSAILVIRELQVKTTMAYHFIFTRTVIIKNKLENNKCWWTLREFRILIHCWWGCKWYSPMESNLTILQNVKHRITIWHSEETPISIPKIFENTFHTKICLQIFIAALSMIANICPLIHEWINKKWYMHIVAIKINQMLIHFETWIKLKKLC